MRGDALLMCLHNGLEGLVSTKHQLGCPLRLVPLLQFLTACLDSYPPFIALHANLTNWHLLLGSSAFLPLRLLHFLCVMALVDLNRTFSLCNLP